MLFRRDKNNSEARPTPQWFKLLVLGFLAYAFLNHWATRNERAKVEGRPELGLSDTLKEAAFPSQIVGVSIDDEVVGKGSPAWCGQRVTASYRVTLKDSALAEAARRKSFILGDGEVIPAITQALDGMRPGGRRTLYASPPFAYDDPRFAGQGVPAGEVVHAEVELHEASPELPESNMPLHPIALKAGEGAQAICGSIIALKLDLWDSAGRHFYASDTKPLLYYRLGEGGLPIGLERGLAGIRIGERRVIIIPPPFLIFLKRELYTPQLRYVTWPKSGVVIAYAERLPDSEELRN